MLPVCEMKVVDENDVELPDGTEGEICIRGANVATGITVSQSSRHRSFAMGVTRETSDYATGWTLLLPLS